MLRSGFEVDVQEHVFKFKAKSRVYSGPIIIYPERDHTGRLVHVEEYNFEHVYRANDQESELFIEKEEEDDDCSTFLYTV
jgi:hypothetical protein